MDIDDLGKFEAADFTYVISVFLSHHLFLYVRYKIVYAHDIWDIYNIMSEAYYKKVPAKTVCNNT